MKIPWKNRAAAWIAFPLLIWTIFAGCGVKALPSTPRLVPPPAVADLRASLDGNALRLTWTAPSGPEWEKSRPAGFRVYKGAVALDGDDCPNCPKTFQRVADIPLSEGESDSGGAFRFTYIETLEPGFQYSYKVMAFSRGAAIGEGSNVAEVVYKNSEL
ncbi:MAG: hypothetical protein GY859_22890 [Desulfobacterales bacterium]|nr:hypothetical protein [Desulfobacterales bacterium]